MPSWVPTRHNNGEVHNDVRPADGQRKSLSNHAEMAKEFDYILNNRNALNEFCRDGRVEIDNNIGENALRRVAVGKKPSFFRL